MQEVTSAMKLPKNPSRRSFLIGTGIGGAAAAVTGTGTKILQATEPAKPSESARQKVSEHVRKYYRTTRI
jgi:hypothetical protein